MDKTLNFLGGVLVGATIMYILDPDRGDSRREIVKDKAANLANRATDEVTTRARDLKNRATGFAHDAINTVASQV